MFEQTFKNIDDLLRKDDAAISQYVDGLKKTKAKHKN
jgi:hypothetical protein